jgi:hypothetical protein
MNGETNLYILNGKKNSLTSQIDYKLIAIFLIALLGMLPPTSYSYNQYELPKLLEIISRENISYKSHGTKLFFY